LHYIPSGHDMADNKEMELVPENEKSPSVLPKLLWDVLPLALGAAAIFVSGAAFAAAATVGLALAGAAVASFVFSFKVDADYDKACDTAMDNRSQRLEHEKNMEMAKTITHEVTEQLQHLAPDSQVWRTRIVQERAAQQGLVPVAQARQT
jgi:hypothetical protein